MQLAPQRTITLSALFLLAGIIVAGRLATLTPWMGLSLGVADDGDSVSVRAIDPRSPARDLIHPGDKILAIGADEFSLKPGDIVEEPDATALYRDYNAFFERQAVLYRALDADSVFLLMGDGRLVSFPSLKNRSVFELPWLFWYQIACGGIAFLAGMGVLAFRPREKVTLYYALSGLGLFLASAAAAVYGTRELALDPALFRQLSLLNQFGTFLFAGPFVSILWYYPRPIHPFPMGAVIMGYYLLSWFLNLFQVSESIDVTMRAPILVGLLINAVQAYLQWRATRTDPVQRAALKWFLLAWMSGTSIYVGFSTVPLMLGVDAFFSQGLGWGIVLTVYLGIALGITRYRLFDLDQWVLTGWYWFLGGVGIILLDALLVSFLKLDDQMALATALAVAGWVYFPFRQVLWRHFSRHAQREGHHQGLLPSLLTIALDSRVHDAPSQWRQALEQAFSPLHIETVPDRPASASLSTDGSQMTVPSVHDSTGLKLTHAQKGGRLFHHEDQLLADSMRQLFDKMQQLREAFQAGAKEERKRVARDLHDDVGAKLLNLVYAAENETQANLARETLQELRDVIRNLEKGHYGLQQTLTEIHKETRHRCEEHAVKLDWHTAGRPPDQTIDSRQHSNLVRIVREAVTNALFHSDTDRIRVDCRLDADSLRLQISNRGVRVDPETPEERGRGMHNIQSRARELGGSAAWQTGEQSLLGGYTLDVELPLGAGNG